MGFILDSLHDGVAIHGQLHAPFVAFFGTVELESREKKCPRCQDTEVEKHIVVGDILNFHRTKVGIRLLILDRQVNSPALLTSGGGLGR